MNDLGGKKSFQSKLCTFKIIFSKRSVDNLSYCCKMIYDVTTFLPLGQDTAI